MWANTSDTSNVLQLASYFTGKEPSVVAMAVVTTVTHNASDSESWNQEWFLHHFLRVLKHVSRLCLSFTFPTAALPQSRVLVPAYAAWADSRINFATVCLERYTKHGEKLTEFRTMASCRYPGLDYSNLTEISRPAAELNEEELSSIVNL